MPILAPAHQGYYCGVRLTGGSSPFRLWLEQKPPLVSCKELELPGSAATLFIECYLEGRDQSGGGVGRGRGYSDFGEPRAWAGVGRVQLRS